MCVFLDILNYQEPRVFYLFIKCVLICTTLPIVLVLHMHSVTFIKLYKLYQCLVFFDVC